MNLREGILIVVVILLAVTLYKRSRAEPHETSQLDCVDANTGDAVAVTVTRPVRHAADCKCPNCSSPELNVTAENTEFFTCSTDGAAGLDCSDAGDGISYVTQPFGAADMEFKDWAMTQAVDGDTIRNHSDFVKDRFAQNRQVVTGRTYSPDSHDSYDPIPWVGLRRPQAVPVCNPTQVPDVNYGLYATKPTFTWRSSE